MKQKHIVIFRAKKYTHAGSRLPKEDEEFLEKAFNMVSKRDELLTSRGAATWYKAAQGDNHGNTKKRAKTFFSLKKVHKNCLKIKLLTNGLMTTPSKRPC